MGIRALGFLKPADYNNDNATYLTKFRENLFKLGAFGFETWQARLYLYKKDKASTDPPTRLLTFNDTSDQNILISKNSILVGDSRFPSLLKNIGFAFGDKKSCVFKVEGLMAQLGDFKVRYGVAIAKDKTAGILFDMEYLPVTKLSVNFNLIFSSVCDMMELQNLRLVTPEQDPENEYSFMILGQNYMTLLSENEIPV